MRLATDNIVIRHGKLAVSLRPSLRAGYLLNERHGFGRLFYGIEELNVSIIGDIIAAASDNPDARRILIAKVDSSGVRELAHLKAPLFELLGACFGIDRDEEHPAEEQERAGKPFSLKAALESLFGIATGVLGWTPDAAMSATPGQIMLAHRAHIAKLKAIHGAADKPKPSDPREEVSREEVEDGISRLKEMARQ